MTARTTPEPRTSNDPLSPHDAILLVSFGGPEKADEVVDFLEVVTRGSGIPRERLAVVGEHYFLFGGRSPINDQNRALIAALAEELAERGSEVPIYWGNRNWHPFIDEAIQQIVADGHQRVLMVTTSAYPSYSGCRQYREAVADSVQRLAPGLQVDRVGHYALDDGFIRANGEALVRARAEVPGARVVFVTHSIPTHMDATSGAEPEGHAYLRWHQEVAARVAGLADVQEHDLVFCSRSGRPEQPWLEPDVNDHLARLAEAGIREVVLAPIGFISDHMEVIYDLDTQARETCEQLGITMVRADTAGTSPVFVQGLVDRLLERSEQARAAQSADSATMPLATGCGGTGCCPHPRGLQLPAVD
ncbi:ferrochelatase [Luteococcus sp. Sow4_B9]|uniref:ferrochelatase n=1 Tax=Luteococcus sp. Sow4_B9 TaxID=3438792 RepID=UPI003F989662